VEFLALIVAVIALFRVSQIERELRELRRQLSRIEAPPRETARPIAAPASAAAPTDGGTAAIPVDFTPASPGAGIPPALRPAAPPPVSPAARTVPAQRPSAAGGLPPRSVSPVPQPDPSPYVYRDAHPDRPSPEGSIERSIGERYLLYAGMVVLVLAVASFLRYAFEQQWLSPLVRVLLGAAAGIGLAAGGRLLARAGYRPYGLFLSGGGLVMLFLSVYAAFAFYALIGQTPAFVLLAAIAGVAAALADRDSSLPLALLAVIGGFATPFLVGGDADAQVTLFSYVALLIAVAAFLAYRRHWAWLSLVTLVLTVLTVVAWADAHYTDAAWLRTQLFLTLYCALFVVMLFARPPAGDLANQAAAAALWAAPALYHCASIAILSPHAVPFLVYLVLVSAAAIAASVAVRAGAVRLVGWMLVVVPLLVWTTTSEGQEWPAAATLAAAGIWLMFVFAIDWVTRRDEAPPGQRLSIADIVLIHAAGPALFAVLYVLWSDEWTPLALAAAGGVLAGVHVAIWSSIRMLTPGALHWLGVAATLAAVSVAVGFEGRWVVALWAAEAVVMVWIGVRLDASWFRTAGVALFGLAAAVWLVWQPDVRIPRLPLLNAHALAAVFTVAMLYASAWTMRRPGGGDDWTWRVQRTILLLGASLLTVALGSFEIAAYWRARPESAVDAALASQLMLSAWWAAYAALLVAVGMRLAYAPIRYFAIGLFAVTLLKVFTADVWQLEGVYRVVGFLAVGTILLVASFLYQRARRVGNSEFRMQNSE
jgi:hypothetical protein